MAKVEISEFRRSAFRSALNVGLALGAFTTSVAFASTAFAQLRTGRSTDREFYDVTETSEPNPMTSNPKTSNPRRLNSEVVQASAKEVVRAEREPAKMTHAPSRQVKKQSPVVRNAGAEIKSSRVEQAGCKNCQAGVAHSHGPIAATRNQPETYADQDLLYEPSTLSEVMYDPDSMVLGSGRESGMAGGTTGFFVQTPNVVGNLLGRMQLRIEAATFWPEGQNLPQLVTTRRPANDPATDGLIGRTDTTNLFGGSDVLGGAKQGIRGELGSYFDNDRSHGFLLRFFDVGSNSLSYISTPNSESVVMRPFFSTANNAQSTIAVNYPNSTSGSLNATISSEAYGGDILFRKSMLRDSAGRLEFLAGYQTARLADSLLIDSTTTALTNIPAPVGTISQLSDQFMTTNRFNGMALGLNGILRERCWTLSGMVKLGFGNMERSVAINGASTITVPGNPGSTSTTANGLLARNTNEGNYVSSTFIVTPETNLTLGYRLTRRLEATLGYSYLGLPKVARVADQLDPQLAANLNNPPSGSSTPSFTLRESNFSLHSLDYGLQWRY